MGKLGLGLICGVILGALAGQVRNQVESPMRSIQLLKDRVIIEGRWKETASTRTIRKPPQINTVYITCDKNSMTCREVIAELVGAKDMTQTNDALDSKFIGIEATDYEIVDWSDGVIHAKYSAQVADFELLISVKDSSAKRIWREREAYGSRVSDTTVYAEWILE
jgi:hypothetical protein